MRPGNAVTVGGVASNTLVSMEPWPDGPRPEPDSGLFYVYAETIDEDNNTIRDSVRVLWSGDAILYLFPTSFTIPNGGSESFTFTVCDIYNNPLTEGTNISVSTTAGFLTGDIDVLLPDTQSRGWTIFYFSLLDDDTEETDPPEFCVITVTVVSENGNVKATASGSID